MANMKFEAILYEINHKKILRIPEQVSKRFSSRGIVMIKGTINNIKVESILEPDGAKSHCLLFSDLLSKKIHANIGDTLSLEIEQSKTFIEPVIPSDIYSTIIANNVTIQWSKITPKARWEWIRWIQSTNNQLTRTKRIRITCSKLKNGEKTPCCFDYSRCSIPSVSKNGVLLHIE